MPISITCEHCSKTLRVKDEIAGKKVKCPQCKGVIVVPKAAPAAASAGGDKQWYVRTDENEDYGPIPRSELDSWVSEGRLNADCQLLAEGSDQWQWASDIYPQLDEPEPAAAAPQAAPKPETPAPTPAPAQPAAAPQQPATPAPAADTSASEGPTIGLPGAAPTPKPAAAGKFDFGVDMSPTARAKGKRVVRKKRGGGGSSISGANPMVKAGQTKSAAGAASGEVGDKSKMVAALLGIFAGGLGIHNFYLGNKGRALTQLLVTVLTCGFGGMLMGPWGLIEGIMILTGSINTDGEGKLLKD